MKGGVVFQRYILTVVALLFLIFPTMVAGSDDSLQTYQERAEQYYEPGVDEQALLERAWNPFDEIKPGMIAPEFSIMDLEGMPHALSDRREQRFVVLEIGNAT